MAKQLCGHNENVNCDCYLKEALPVVALHKVNSSNETMKRVWNNSGPLTRMWMLLTGNTPNES